MTDKIKRVYDELESLSEQLADLQTQGVVDGWDETLRCTNTPKRKCHNPE